MYSRKLSSEECTSPLAILWGLRRSRPRTVTLLMLLVLLGESGRFGINTLRLEVVCSCRWDLIGESPTRSPRTCTPGFFTFY